MMNKKKPETIISPPMVFICTAYPFGPGFVPKISWVWLVVVKWTCQVTRE